MVYALEVLIGREIALGVSLIQNLTPSRSSARD